MATALAAHWRVTGENVGAYAIGQGTLGLNGNYSLTFAGADLTITARAITVTADAKSKTYGDADPAFTYQIATGTLASGDSFGGALARVTGENVGGYAISQGTLALSSNYSLTFAGADLTISARSITVTADAKSKTYGDADPALTYQIATGTLVSGDSFTGALARMTGENVGAYAIGQGSLALNSNYSLTFAGANLTISARSITVTVDAKSKTYGDADPAFTYQIATGTLVSGDSFTGALARAAGENVGAYAIGQGTLALSSNYSLTFVGANLTIIARAVTVTADAKSKTQGSADPTLSYQITTGTLVSGDSFSGALARAAGESVGTYAILQGTLALSSNYVLSFVGANLTILPGSTGTLGGYVFRDMSGNGFSTAPVDPVTNPADVPLGGVTVNLYRDTDGDNTLDAIDSTPIASVVSDATTGAYSFANLPAGSYCVGEVVPTGYVRTVPLLAAYYSADVATGSSLGGLNFDNYKLCTATVTSVSFTVTTTSGSTQTVTDLRGNTHQGDTVTATFTLGGTTPARISLASYDAPTPTFQADNASQQTIFDIDSEILSPGRHTLTVTIPTNYYQIDFVKCFAINQLGPAGSNIFYSAESRLISADNGGTHSDTEDLAAATEFWANLGQSLIRSFNVTAITPNPTALANWLSQNFPSLYGSCGSYSLVGKHNADVATMFMNFYRDQSHHKTDAAVMATALNVYASTNSLGGAAADGTDAQGHEYGFDSTDAGLGAAQFNVLNNGAAFNVSNNSTLTVWQLLQAANAKSKSDVLYNGVSSMLTMAYTMFETVNNSGGIV